MLGLGTYKVPSGGFNSQFSSTVRPGGTRKNFDRDVRVTFLGLKFNNLLFFGVAQNEGYILGGGVEKLSIIFGGQLEICIIVLGC